MLKIKLLLLPFKIVEYIIKFTGRMMAVILGLVFLAIGIALSLTIIGAIIGVPLAIIGFLMIIRGFF